MPEHAMQGSCIWQFIGLSLNLKAGCDVAIFKEPPIVYLVITSQLVCVSIRVIVIWLFTEVCYVCFCCIAVYSISETKDSFLMTSASGIICGLTLQKMSSDYY